VDTRPTRARYVLLSFTLLLTAVAYLDRVCISTASGDIKRDLGLSDAQLGYVFSAFTFSYALFEIPSGWLADRFGPRLMLTRIVVWWSLMTAATGLARGFASLFFIRLLFGLGEAGAFPGIARAFARWLPRRDHGRAFGLAVMTGVLGGALTQPLVVSLLRAMSWRHAFAIFGVVGLGWAALWFAWFRDDPRDHQGVNPQELAIIGAEPPVPHSAVPWGELLRDRSLLGLCVMYGGTIYGWYFFLTWLPQYLLRARGFALREVGWLAALPLVCIALGVFTGGWWSDLIIPRVGRKRGRRLPGMVGLPLAAAAILLAIATPSPRIAAVALSIGAGLAALAVAPAWATCLDVGGRHAGVVTGAMNTFGNLGGTLSPLVVGLWLQHNGSWDGPLVTVAVCYLVSAACWLTVDAGQEIPGTA
jgi:ACS family glucarate transporter-like MFS transporter